MRAAEEEAARRGAGGAAARPYGSDAGRGAAPPCHAWSTRDVGDFFVLLFLTTASFDTRGLFAMIFFGVTSGVTLLAGWGRLPAVVLAAAAGRADGARGCAAVGDVPLRTGTGIPRWVFFAGD